ncbi:MAG: hypothetical protein M0Z31_14955 [Clostridia bacterium]|nr:hypothetical protein [Clostridia bacterium]
MKMRYFYLLTVFLLALTLTAGCTQPIKKPAEEGANRAAEETRQGTEKLTDKAQENLPVADLRTLQEVAADDKYTKGCLSCHKVDNGQDRTLKTTMKKFKKHPPVASNATIKNCLSCHRKKPARLAKLQLKLHQAHAKSETFYPKLKGTCVSCHKIKDNGDIQVKGE